jgi:hypothetical protein
MAEHPADNNFVIVAAVFGAFIAGRVGARGGLGPRIGDYKAVFRRSDLSAAVEVEWVRVLRMERTREAAHGCA